MSVRRLAEQQPPSFAFTPENRAWADKLIAKYPKGRQASAVIPLLWRAQEQHDYWLPKAAIEAVADMLGMNRLRVLEVATFYTMFNLAPVGRHFIQLCGTPPCHVKGAVNLRRILERRVGPQQTVSAEGFSWLEVECLGACCNAPMAQINNDYYEDLTEENFLLLLDDLAAGRPVKKGSQTGRVSSEPTPGKGTTLADPTLYDGSRVGAWKKRFEEEQARQASAAAEAAAAKEAAARDAAAAAAPAKPPGPASTGAAAIPAGSAQAPTVAAKPASPSSATPEATLASAPAPARSASAVEPQASGAAASSPTHAAADREIQPAGGVRAIAATVETADPAAAAREAQAAQEEAEIKAKLATLSKDATPQQKADAVGARPAGLAAARGGVADDLKRIKGIGKVNEGRLNELGVFHFDQIAAWTRPEIRWVGTYLAFPGRIDREDWTGQAKLLAQGLETEFSRRVDRGEVSTSTGGPSRPDKTK